MSMDADPTKDESPVASGGVEVTRQRSAELFAQLRDESSAEADRDAAREGLVHLHLPLVEHCARRFRNRGEPYEDLVQVGVPSRQPTAPDEDSFAWQVLTTLATKPSASTDDHRFTITLSMQSALQESAP